eukprot:TRINITY_DN145_c1_g1_i3.p1 TRINITY_DN145_c1_g1~~TRINITY_DN145_c1_g1_i3.p1  ORF type:complete len:493 (-),score=138.39 TRINITY_DN145_c1_g1_i3:1309-2787(-)
MFGTSFGSTTTTPLFGGGTAQTSSTPSFGGSTTSLFGNTTPSSATPTTTTTNTSLFGNPSTSSTTSLFGNTNTSSTTTSSLFSNPTSTSATPTNSLFGNPTSNANPSGLTTTSTPLFGATNSSLFGGPTTPTTSSSLFGNTATPATGSLFGNPATSIGQTEVTWDQNYSQLPDSLQKQITEIQRTIFQQKNKAEEIKENEKKISKVGEIRSETQLLKEKTREFTLGCTNESSSLEEFKKQVSDEIRNAEWVIRTRERIQMQSYQPTPPPSPYFSQLASSFELKMRQYHLYIEEIEKYFMSLQKSHQTPAMIQEIMKNQHDFFLILAARAANLSDLESEQRDLFIRYRKQYLGLSQDPFDDGEASQKKVRPSVQQQSLPNPSGPLPSASATLPPFTVATPQTPVSIPTTSFSLPTSTPSSTLSPFPNSSAPSFNSPLFPSTTPTPSLSTSFQNSPLSFPSTFNSPSAPTMFGQPTASPVLGAKKTSTRTSKRK